MDRVKWWKEFYGELLNPINIFSQEEAEHEDLAETPKSLATLAEVAQKLHSSKTPGLVEIRGIEGLLLDSVGYLRHGTSR